MISAETTMQVEDKEVKDKEVTKVLRKRKRKKIRVSLINTGNCRYDLVRYTATKFGMKESLENWNVYWTDLSISVQRCKEMKRFQRINHFPGMLEICRKDLLARNLNRLFKAFPEDYDVFPKTWCLPADLMEVAEYAKAHKGRCFIVKPDLGCQGRGICITRNINQLKTYDKMICQLYIHRPFLIDGYKFDLRIYTLITSCDPLRIFVYNEGLARFATAKYKEPNSANASNMYMHLTNYSVNKHSRTYIVDEIDGSKRKLSTINQWFLKNSYDVKKLWDSIDDAIIKTVIVSLPTLRHYYHTCFPNHLSSHACFEILGFDFMFDQRLKPYVLEVNHSPSFHTDTAIDHEVKESLLYDTFSILNLSQNNRVKVLIEDKRRARDRLFTTTLSSDVLYREKEQDDQLTLSRVEWEESHLGNYRKIYPNQKMDYYEKFIGARQNTVYAAREAKVQGEHALTKAKLSNVSPSPKRKEGLTQSKPKSAPESTCITKTFEPETIDEQDEKERVVAMQKREFLVRSHGILERVYENMKNAGLLKMEDEIKHGRNNKWDDKSQGPKTYQEQYQQFNKSITAVLACARAKEDVQFGDLNPLEEDRMQEPVSDGRNEDNPKAAAGKRLQDRREPEQHPPVTLNDEIRTAKTINDVDSQCKESNDHNKQRTDISPFKHPKWSTSEGLVPIQEYQQGPVQIKKQNSNLIAEKAVTPITSSALNVGHFGPQNVWPSLEHLMGHRTIPNRSSQSNDVNKDFTLLL